MKKSELKAIIRECIESIYEAKIGGQKVDDVPVYDTDRKTIIAYVDKRSTSIGAAKAAGKSSAKQERVNGKLSWVVKELEEDRDYKKEYNNYHSSPEQKTNRASRNNARRRFEREGKVSKGDGKDVDHKNPIRSGGSNTDKNLRVRSVSSNRSDNGQGK